MSTEKYSSTPESNENLILEALAPVTIINADIPAVKGSSPNDESRPQLKKIAFAGKRALETIIMHAEAKPFINEPLRYGIAATILAKTKNPDLATAYFAASSGLLEGGAAVASADVLTNNSDAKLIHFLRAGLNQKKVKRILYTNEGRLPLSVQSVVGLYAGTSILMTAKEMEQDSGMRKTRANRLRYGLKAAALIMAACAAESMFGSQAIEHIKDPVISVPTTAALVVSGAIYKKTKSTISNIAETLPRYDLSEDEINDLEHNLAKEVRKRTPEEGVYAVWLSPDSKYSNIIRTKEASYFPEVSYVSNEDETRTKFLAMVDTRREYGPRKGLLRQMFRRYNGRVVHGTSVSLYEESESSTGLYTIDELIKVGNFTVQDFKDYYAAKGINLTHSISVDTNFMTVKRPHSINVGGNKIRPGDLAYSTIFQLISSQTLEGETTLVFASLNQKSIKSLNRLGIKTELLMGRDDFVTPESLLPNNISKDNSERNQDTYLPVAIILDDDLTSIYKSKGYQVTEVDLT